MGLSGFRLLHLRHLRRHPGRAVLAALAVATATATVAAVDALDASMVGSVQDLTAMAGNAAAEVAVPGDGGLPPGTADATLRTAGVTAVVPLVRTAATVGGHQALLFGVDATATHLDGPLGAAVKARQADVERRPDVYLTGVLVGPRLAAATGARAGGRTRVFSGRGGSHDVPVIAVLDTSDPLANLNRGDFVVALLPTAETLAGHPGRPDVVFALADPGADGSAIQARIAARLGQSALVSSPQRRVDEAAAGVEEFNRILVFIAGLILLVAALLVLDVTSMLALERRRDLATLRALGGRRRRLLIGFIGQVLVVGVAGTAAGCVLGVALAAALLPSIPPMFASTLGIGFSFHLGATTIPLAVAAGLGAALAGSLPPALAALRASPVQGMRPVSGLAAAVPARVLGWPTIAGALALTAGLLLIFVLGVDRTPPGMVTTLVLGGLALLTWGLQAPASRALARLVAAAGPPGLLAGVSITRAPRRAWLASMVVALAVTVAVAVDGVSANARVAAASSFASWQETSVVVQSAPVDDIPVTGLPASLTDQLMHLPGVTNVAVDYFGFARAGGSQVLVEGLDPRSYDPFLRNGGPRLLGPGSVLVSRALARQTGVRDGGRLSLQTPSGARTLTIRGVVDVIASSDLRAMAITAQTFSSWFGGSPGRFEATATPGTDTRVLASSARRLVSAAGIPAVVATGPELGRGQLMVVDQIVVVFLAMKWIAAAAAFLAVVDAWLIALAERRRELGILRALGARRALVRRMVFTEALAVATAGGIVGVVAGSIIHYAGVVTFADVVGFGFPYAPQPGPVAATVIAAIVVAAAAALVPANAAARADIIGAIGYE